MVNFHYAYPDAVLLNYGLGKALSYDETGFLGRDDDAYRRQAWNFMLSGGSTFDNLDYSFSPGHEDGTDAEPTVRGGSAALRGQLRVLSDPARLHAGRSASGHSRREARGGSVRARLIEAGERIRNVFRREWAD